MQTAIEIWMILRILYNFQPSKMKLDKVEYPKMLDKIENDDYRQWALELHQIWQQEGINTSNHLVKDNPRIIPYHSSVEIQATM